jgi:hypothetical protein
MADAAVEVQLEALAAADERQHLTAARVVQAVVREIDGADGRRVSTFHWRLRRDCHVMPSPERLEPLERTTLQRAFQNAGGGNVAISRASKIRARALM